jgi:hypothetical protein
MGVHRADSARYFGTGRCAPLQVRRWKRHLAVGGPKAARPLGDPSALPGVRRCP